MKLTNEVFKDKNAPVSALLAAFLKKYGTAALAWQPELMRKCFKEDYDIEMTNLQMDKLHAGIVILTTDQFEQTWKAFEACCHLMCGVPDELDTVNPLDAEEIAAGVAEAALIKHEVLEYGDDVLAYAGHIFHEYGFSHAPKLFPNAIMPSGTVMSNDDEKNEALKEIFDAHLERVSSYLQELEE